jgi:hypothetical protein
MRNKIIPTATLNLKHIPAETADVDVLIDFAHTFDGYAHWGSNERCAQIANTRDHGSIDKLRTCLFFEARRWRHFGESPDDDALGYWRSLVKVIRQRLERFDSFSPDWLADAIRKLPADEAVPARTQGYNQYLTQKDHWLGWLNPHAGTGTYPRSTGANVSARMVYNRIGEPKMLLWLASAAGAPPELVTQARKAADQVVPLASQCAAVRKVLPWRVLAEVLDGKVNS